MKTCIAATPNNRSVRTSTWQIGATKGALFLYGASCCQGGNWGVVSSQLIDLRLHR